MEQNLMSIPHPFSLTCLCLPPLSLSSLTCIFRKHAAGSAAHEIPHVLTWDETGIIPHTCFEGKAWNRVGDNVWAGEDQGQEQTRGLDFCVVLPFCVVCYIFSPFALALVFCTPPHFAFCVFVPFALALPCM